MGAVRFLLLGKLCIEADGGVITKIESRKAEELLVYLLLHRDQPHSREHLADLLWSLTSQDQGSGYLRKALWQLQSSLENWGVNGQELIHSDGDYLQVNSQFACWLDVDILEAAFNQTKGMFGRNLSKNQAQSLERAVEIYRGELLDGWYSDWCLYERDRLQYLYFSILDKLMDYCEAQGAFESGLAFGAKILHYDRAHERTHRRLMRLHYLAGDRTSALRQYHACIAALKEELDVSPAENTRLVYEQIRSDSVEAPVEVRPTARTGAHRPDADPLTTLYSDLNIVQKKLSQMQQQILEDIRVIERSMRGH